MPTKVVHCKKQIFDIYIGRPTIFGNLWTHKSDGTAAKYVVKTREEAVYCYRQWLLGLDFFDVEQEKRNEIIRRLPELKDQILGCWCSPQKCHGDVLVEILEDIPYE